MKQTSPEKERTTRFGRSFVEIAPGLHLVLARKFGMSREDADDLLHETLVECLDRIRSSNKPMSFEQMELRVLRKYLLVAAVNRYRDRLKHRQVVERSESELLFVMPKSTSPELHASHKEEVQNLHAAVNALNEPYRSLFRALLSEDITLAELARRKRIKLGTVYTQFQRGVEALRRIWERQKPAGIRHGDGKM